jgi:hypothetical protein
VPGPALLPRPRNPTHPRARALRQDLPPPPVTSRVLALPSPRAPAFLLLSHSQRERRAQRAPQIHPPAHTALARAEVGWEPQPRRSGTAARAAARGRRRRPWRARARRRRRGGGRGWSGTRSCRSSSRTTSSSAATTAPSGPSATRSSAPSPGTTRPSTSGRASLSLSLSHPRPIRFLAPDPLPLLLPHACPSWSMVADRLIPSCRVLFLCSHLGGFLLFLALAVAGGARGAADEAAPGIMRYVREHAAHDSFPFLHFLNELQPCSYSILRKRKSRVFNPFLRG